LRDERPVLYIELPVAKEKARKQLLRARIKSRWPIWSCLGKLRKWKESATPGPAKQVRDANFAQRESRNQYVRGFTNELCAIWRDHSRHDAQAAPCSWSTEAQAHSWVAAPARGVTPDGPRYFPGVVMMGTCGRCDYPLAVFQPGLAGLACKNRGADPRHHQEKERITRLGVCRWRHLGLPDATPGCSFSAPRFFL